MLLLDDMVEPAIRHYNLRYQERYSLTVQLHLSNDSKIVSDLLASDRATKIRQVSDSEWSI